MSSGRTWLVIDISALAYRALYTLGDLSFEGVSTGVTYGIFNSLMNLIDVHNTRNVVWAFDRGYDKRTELCPTYKQTRHKEEKPEITEARRSLRKQLYKLRTEYLPGVGYKNIFFQDGYEADDVIASVCQNLDRGDTAVIVSSDEDLFQLLSPTVSMWLPKSKMVTQASFVEEWGIDPFMWADVKALAGCTSDNVQGIRGIGDKKACLYLRGKLKPDSKAFQLIAENGEVWKKNLPLVRLPFPGIEVFKAQEDLVDEEKWESLLESLGFKSLRGRSRGRERRERLHG